MINVNITKNPTESGASILRRFTKKVQESGVLNKVRSKRASLRTLSSYKVKKSALERLRRQNERERLLKLGKITVSPKKKR